MISPVGSKTIGSLGRVLCPEPSIGGLGRLLRLDQLGGAVGALLLEARA